LTLQLVKAEDCTKTNNRKYGKNTRIKRCTQCGTRKANLDLTELTNSHGRLKRNYLCDECDKIMALKLVKAEDCSFDARLKEEKMTTKEKGWNTRKEKWWHTRLKLIKAEDVIEENPVF
jgi:protein-arginine kinase activator protein McsA